MPLLCAGAAVISPGTRRVYNVKQYNSLPVTEQRVYSQHGEDGAIASLFGTIGMTNHFFVEIGCGDGSECNTRRLTEVGWNGFKLDCAYEDAEQRIYKEKVTPDNVPRLLDKYACPGRPDLFSIDIDSTDWQVLHRVLQQYQPRLIVAEYNANLGFLVDAVVVSWHTEWDGSRYFGASYAAFKNLARRFHYRIVYVESSGTNMFMLHQDCCPQEVLDSELCLWLPGPMLGEDTKNRPWRRSSDFLIWD